MRTIAIAIALMLVLLSSLTTAAQQAQQQDDEAAAGEQTYQDLKNQGVLVASSPLYDTLKPIAQQITRIVQPQYGYPIHFYIVHGNQPNAFAAPGGNVYVIDSLMYFVRNREELAGTICHETSHLIHHDSMKEASHDETIRRRQLLGAILLGGKLGAVLTVSAIGKLDSLHYSRGAEEAADLTGADTCARAGLNPWGLVWLFSDFSNANFRTPPEFLSDHPGDQQRVAALEQHFKQNPAMFASFSSDRRSGTRLKLPKNEAEQFVR